MVETTPPHREHVEQVRELLEKFHVENHLLDASAGERRGLESTLLHRQQAVELERRLRGLHAADLADLLESLPPDARELVWFHIPAQRRGEVLLELDDAVKENLIAHTSKDDLLSALAGLDADDLAYLGKDLPADIFHQALEAQASEDRRWIRDSLSYPEEEVGHWMSSEMVVVHQDQTLQAIQALLQQQASLPTHTDKLFVTDQRGLLCGVLFLQDILVNAPDVQAKQVMTTQVVTFAPDDDADDTARAFERYDLVSAPVVNERGKLVGRLTVDMIMDYVREAAEKDALNVAGVVEGEDLFAGIWASARNRWPWLSINLLTAFVISRIIGGFEGTIGQLVALASLMPIIASVAGNTGNQTTAIVIRSLALDQLHAGNIWHLFRKELAIAALNGAVWGVVVGLFAFVFYQNPQLSVVVTVAMMLTFVLAALFGVSAPLVLERMGGDPAMGSSVILTGVTDALGFFIFLTLATLFLV